MVWKEKGTNIEDDTMARIEAYGQEIACIRKERGMYRFKTLN